MSKPKRPYILLSCCMSLDGYIDDSSQQRLLLSNAADFDRVDAVRASCDAILVGAATIRKDNPRLLVRDARRRTQRVAEGLPPSPIKVTVTDSTRLDVRARFFATGEAEKLVYCATTHANTARRRLGAAATVIDAGTQVDMRWLSEDLHHRGVHRLMVEGGESIHTQFLAAGIVDELQLVVAPFLLGDSNAPRFVSKGQFPWTPTAPARLMETRAMEDVVLLRYALSPRFV